jgi:hypothetical protein
LSEDSRQTSGADFLVIGYGNRSRRTDGVDWFVREQLAVLTFDRGQHSIIICRCERCCQTVLH